MTDTNAETAVGTIDPQTINEIHPIPNHLEAIDSRVSGLELIDPTKISTLPLAKLNAFFSPNPEVISPEITDQEAKSILSELDLVYVLSNLESLDQPIETIISQIKAWKQTQIDRLNAAQATLPHPVKTQADVTAYLEAITVTPPHPNSIRPDQINRLVEVTSSQIKPDTNLEADSIRYLMTMQDAIKARDKWWVMGFTGDHNIDPVTQNLISALETSQLPECADVIMRTLFRKANQDIGLYESIRFPPPDSDLSLDQVKPIEAATTHLGFAALDISPQLSFVVLNRLLTDPSQPPYIHELVGNIITHPRLLSPPERQADGRFVLHGKEVIFPDLPSNTHHLTRPVGQYLACLDESGQCLKIYRLHPLEALVDPSPTIMASAEIKFNDFLEPGTQSELNQEEISQFLMDSPALVNAVSNAILDPDFIPQQYHPAVFYHLWLHEGKRVALSDNSKVLLENFGQDYLNLFTGGLTPDETAILTPLLVSLKDTPTHPPDYDPNLITYYRSEKTVTQWLLRRHDEVVTDSLKIAQMLYPNNPAQAQEISQLLREHSKHLLLTSARLHQDIIQAGGSGLEPNETQFVLDALGYQRIFLQSLTDREFAAKNPVPLKLVNHYASRMNLGQTEANTFLRSALLAWCLQKAQAQTQAAYAAQVDLMTSQFYKDYSPIERDPTLITNNPEVTIPINLSQLSADIGENRLPSGAKVLFSGSGHLISEKPIIEALLQHDAGIKVIAADPHVAPPENMNVTFYPTSLQELANHPQLLHQVDRLYALGSPLMDVILLPDLIQALNSISQVMAPNGVFCTDNAYRLGDHSYRAEEAANFAQNPKDPETLFYRTWKIDQIKALESGPFLEIGKYFQSTDPVVLIPLLNQLGFNCLNYPSHPLEILLTSDCLAFDDALFTLEPQAYAEILLANPNFQSILAPYLSYLELNIPNGTLAEKLSNILTKAKPALYQTQDATRTYNRWLVRFQKVRESTPIDTLNLELITAASQAQKAVDK